MSIVEYILEGNAKYKFVVQFIISKILNILAKRPVPLYPVIQEFSRVSPDLNLEN